MSTTITTRYETTVDEEDRETRQRQPKLTTRDRPGEFAMIDKTKLNVDLSYQRKTTKSRVDKIREEWSWIAFGAVSVALRGDGEWFVMDGQHRVLAAMMRDDIKEVPC